MVADKLFRLGQTTQTEWFLLPKVFQAICIRWHRPQIDLFATRFNNKLPLLVSPVLDPLATAVDALSVPSEDLNTYDLKAFDLQDCFPLGPWGKRRSEIHAWQIEILDTNLIGQRCTCIHHPAFYPRISWPKRAQTVWPQWLYQPWPQLWIGPSVRSELCATIWTGPQAE